MVNNMRRGAVLFARKTIDSEIFFWKPDKWFKIWFYLVSRMNHTSNNMFDRGENLVTYRDISEKTKATKDQIDKFIRWAKKNEMLTTRKTTRGMIVTLNKYKVYQDLVNYKSDTQDELKAKRKRNGSDTITKNDKNDKNIIIQKKEKLFTTPTTDEVKEYCLEKGYHIDPEQFVSWNTSKGWMIGKNKMKCWKSACTTWELVWKKNNPQDETKPKVDTL